MSELSDLKYDLLNLRSEMNAVKAELYAHQIMLGDVFTQMVFPREDWKERLGVFRQNAINGARNFELIGGDPATNATLKREIERRIDEHFSSVLDGLTEWQRRPGSDT